MVSDAEIVRQLTAVLRHADLNTTTTTAIRQQLESDLGIDLSEKKLFIRQQVDLYLQKQSQEHQEEGDDEVSEEKGERDQEEDDEDGDGGEEEQDENDSTETGKSSKTRGEPESKRMRAKIDRAIKARYRESWFFGFV